MAVATVVALGGIEAQVEYFMDLCQNYGILLADGLPLTDLQDAQELLDEIQTARTEIWCRSFEQRLNGEVSGNYADKHVLNPMQVAYKQFITAWVARRRAM
jgi:hypothetical protein